MLGGMKPKFQQLRSMSGYWKVDAERHKVVYVFFSQKLTTRENAFADRFAYENPNLQRFLRIATIRNPSPTVLPKSTPHSIYQIYGYK